MTATASSLASRCGPWAVVTGASSGIGRAFAQHLAASGLHVVLVARSTDVLQRLATELHGAHGVQARALPLDLGVPGAGERLAAATADLDVGLLVAAAGFGAAGPLLDGDARVDADMLAVNCGAVLQQCHHFGRRFVARGRGGIVLLSSVVAFQGTPGSACYAASKAFVQSLAEALHHELAGSGVQVIASAPGPIDSGFAARAGMRLGRAQPPDVVAAGTLEALGRRATVRPGWLAKLLGWSLATMPRQMRVRVMAKVMAGMRAPG